MVGGLCCPFETFLYMQYTPVVGRLRPLFNVQCTGLCSNMSLANSDLVVADTACVPNLRRKKPQEAGLLLPCSNLN